MHSKIPTPGAGMTALNDPATIRAWRNFRSLSGHQNGRLRLSIEAAGISNQIKCLERSTANEDGASVLKDPGWTRSLPALPERGMRKLGGADVAGRSAM
jgi:hypothetical protein